MLWLGCSQSGTFRGANIGSCVFEVHHESAAIDALVTDLLASNDKTEEAWGSYLLSREIVRKGVNFEALTYLERQKFFFALRIIKRESNEFYCSRHTPIGP